MIHVCFCFHDKNGRYAKFAGTAMLSLFENSSTPPPSTCVHILHDNTLTQDNREKFIYLAGRYGQLVKFYNVEELCADKIAEFRQLTPNAWATIGCLFKFLISKVIPIEIQKIIYLDSDIIVNLDIKELWQIDLGEYMLAGVPEIFNDINTVKQFLIVADGLVKAEDYFNSGVLLMNLKSLRKEDSCIIKGIKFREENPRQMYWDQTVFNYCFSTRALHLPKKFNCFVYHASLNNAAIEKNIYHYVPKPQALGLNMNNPFNRLWMSYFMKTPFFDEYAIGRLYNGFEQIHVELKNSMTKLSALMSGKTRAFFTLPHNVEATKEIFSIRDDEDIILAENQASLQKLIDVMKISQGKKIFFIMLPNFPFAALTQAGFVYGKDFLNGLEFLSEANGLPLNSYSLIQAL